MDWSTFDDKKLLSTYCALMAELEGRGIVRSANNPVADYSETLVSGALGLSLEPRSKAGYDALGGDGTRYQIKGRRLTAENSSPQLGAIRNLAQRPFDILAAVVYAQDLSVLYGALIPVEVVVEQGRYSPHTNSHIFMFRRNVLEDARVTDITRLLAAPVAQLVAGPGSLPAPVGRTGSGSLPENRGEFPAGSAKEGKA